jgi:hypothetical protein
MNYNAQHINVTKNFILSVWIEFFDLLIEKITKI